MANSLHPTITVGQLRQELEAYSDDCDISFSGLDFKRIKRHTPQFVQVEFNQHVYRTEAGQVVVANID